jgi:hypothetical protein
MARQVLKKDWQGARTVDGRVVVILAQGNFAGATNLIGYAIEANGKFTLMGWDKFGVDTGSTGLPNANNNINLSQVAVSGVVNIYKAVEIQSGYLAKFFLTQAEADANSSQDSFIVSINVAWQL